jgi:molybdopterin synthase sulfur carrier subunit
MSGEAPAVAEDTGVARVRLVLPYHLRTLSGTGKEVVVAVTPPATQRSVLDALESAYPMLKGTLRDPATGRRRPFIRFFAAEEDLSHDAPDDGLPEAVAAGQEVLFVVGAMAGG